MTTTNDSLHLAFASRAAEVQQNKEVVQRRVAAELYWLDQWLDHSAMLPRPNDLLGPDGLDPVEDANYLGAIANLSRPELGVHQIYDILTPLTTDEIERFSWNAEMTVGPIVAAEIELKDEDLSEEEFETTFNQRLKEIHQMANECGECRRGLSMLVMSYVAHPITLSPYTCMSIAHTGEDTANPFYDDLATSLDYAWERAVEAKVGTRA